MHQLSHNLNQWWLIKMKKKKKKNLLGLNSHLPRSRWLQNLRNVSDFTCDPQNECMPSPLFRGGSCTKLNSAKELCRASNLIMAVRDKNTTRSWTLISGCKDCSVYVPSQWETTLHCNVGSHWLGPYTKQSLGMPWKLVDGGSER